jgi:RHS repeat-associated protein
VTSDSYAYDPYGKVVGRQGSTPNPFTYGGRSGIIDDGNGFYYMMSRYYIPSFGRFAQQEMIYRGSLTQPQSLNRYAFVEGNPIDRIDPRGECWTCFVAGVGAAVGAASQIASNVTDKPPKPWQQGVVGAAVAGAVNAAAESLGPFGAGALGSALGTAVNQAIGTSAGGEGAGLEFDLEKIAVETAKGGAEGWVGSKLGKAWKKFRGKAGSPSDILKNLDDLEGGWAALTAAEKAWVRSNLIKGVLIDVGLAAATLAGKQAADVIKGKLGRTDENHKPKPQFTPAVMWGLDRTASPGGSYLIDALPGVVPGNPQ